MEEEPRTPEIAFNRKCCDFCESTDLFYLRRPSKRGDWNNYLTIGLDAFYFDWDIAIIDTSWLVELNREMKQVNLSLYIKEHKIFNFFYDWWGCG